MSTVMSVVMTAGTFLVLTTRSYNPAQRRQMRTPRQGTRSCNSTQRQMRTHTGTIHRPGCGLGLPTIIAR